MKEKILSFTGKNKYLLLIMSVGLLFILWPDRNDGAAKSGQAQPPGYPAFDLAEAENEIAEALRQVSGAGRVEVVLTLKSDITLVIEQREVVKRIYPEFRGALIVCEGAGIPAVKLAVIESVSVLTGLGSDKISVVKKGI